MHGGRLADRGLGALPRLGDGVLARPSGRRAGRAARQILGGMPPPKDEAEIKPTNPYEVIRRTIV